MSGAITITILSEGKKISSEYSVLSVETLKTVNKIPYAQITLIDGNAAKRNFVVSNDSCFEPGKNIEIKMRYEGEKDTTIFKGIVIRQKINAGLSGSTLVVDIKDSCLKLHAGRKSVVYADKKDSEIIEEILQRQNIKISKVESTEVKHKQIAQYYCTDWDFIVSRAEANGHLVSIDDGQFSMYKPDITQQPNHTINYGIDQIYKFDMELDISKSYQRIESIGWDIKQQKCTEPQTAQKITLTQGNIDNLKLAALVGRETCELISGISAEREELQAWADAAMVKSCLSVFRGIFTIAGNSDIKLGDSIEILGVGNRFNGNTMVSGVRHEITAERWLTDVQFGIAPTWFYVNNDLIDKPAAGLVPGINGLQIGVVQDFTEDANKNFRIKIYLPVMGENAESIWARLLVPDAGNAKGIFFIPEKGNEVIVGFLNDDPRDPVVLGGLYSQVNMPPFDFTAENNKKGIITKNNLQIVFDDQAKKIEVNTGSNKVVIEDNTGIQLEDKNGNKCIFDASGITLKSSGAITIEGLGNVKIKGAIIDLN